MRLTDENVNNLMWRNTISNYVCVVARLLTGLVLFRILWQTLPEEDLGFWGVMWTIFGYGILLDFGFGFTVQKRVAELAVHENWKELTRVVSTIFYMYLMIGGVIMIAGVIGAPSLIKAFEVTAANESRFSELLVVFFIGLGLAFPLGIFPEMLRGLQRISLANYIQLCGMLANFGLALWILTTGLGLKVLLLSALACTFIPELICGVLIFRILPQVRIRVRDFSPPLIRRTMSFSLYAYLITVSNLILTKTDQLVLSTGLALSAVPIYMAGAKVAEMFYAFTQQLPDTLSPVAAHYHAKGGRVALRDLLVNGTRFSLMVATPLYCLCALMMGGILRLLTNDPELSPEVFWVAQILLFWMYNMVTTQSVCKRIFVMCGHERRLMWLSMGEAGLNLGLSVGLLLYFQQVWCVALGSLISTMVFGWCFLWPWAAREANVSGVELARTVLFPTWAACVPLLVLMTVENYLPISWFGWSLPSFLFQVLVGFAVACGGVWLFGLNGHERDKLAERFGKKLSRGTPA